MARPPSRQPTEGELEILHVLWDSGPSELGTVRLALQKNRVVATTTIATMLKLMETKGLVQRMGAVEGGRGLLWTAKVSKKTAQAGLLQRLLDLAFEGSAHRLVSHMLEDDALSDGDRAAIRTLLEEANEVPKARKRGGKL